MKKLYPLLLLLFLFQISVNASNDVVIEMNQLPKVSRQFIEKHFPKTSVALVKMDKEFFDKSYEVIFTNGNKLEFAKNGEWKDVDCRYTEFPSAIVPQKIKTYITKNYRTQKVIRMSKENKGRIEVGLSNGLDLTFDSKLNLIEIDN